VIPESWRVYGPLYVSSVQRLKADWLRCVGVTDAHGWACVAVDFASVRSTKGLAGTAERAILPSTHSSVSVLLPQALPAASFRRAPQEDPALPADQAALPRMLMRDSTLMGNAVIAGGRKGFGWVETARAQITVSG
jgi:hypothetical protein